MSGWFAAGTVALLTWASLTQAEVAVNVLEPLDGFVFLDGRLAVDSAGKPLLTPVTLHGLTTGEHVIAVAKPGYRDRQTARRRFEVLEDVRLPAFTRESEGVSLLLARRDRGDVQTVRLDSPDNRIGTDASNDQPESAPVSTPTPKLRATGRIADRLGELVELMYSFDRAIEADDFELINDRAELGVADGQLMLSALRPGLAGLRFRLPVRMRELHITGQITRGDHLIWQIRPSSIAESDTTWRPRDGVAGIWRGDGAMLITRAVPTPPDGPPAASGAAFQFSIALTPSPAGTGETLRWQLNGVSRSVEINPPLAGQWCDVVLATWDSTLAINELRITCELGELPADLPVAD